MLFLLALIKGGVVDPVAQMSRTQDRMYNNKAFQKPDVDVNNGEQQDAAVKIQTKYRQHQSKAVVDQMRQDKAATKIQAGIRGHLGRKRVSHLRKQVAGSSHGSINAADDGNDLEELAQEDEFNINDYEEEETARTQGSIEMTPRITALPAIPSEAVQPGSNETEEIDIDLGDPEVQKAAVFIQSGFRGLKSRRKTAPPPSSSPPQPTPLLPSPIPPSLPLPAITQTSTLIQMDATPPPPPAAASQPDGKETEEIDIDLGDPEVQKAAAFIQSGFRGLKSRRKTAPSSSPQPQPTPPPPPTPPATIQTSAISEVESDDATVRKSPANEDEEGEGGFDLNDPGVQSAATKIQAGFRGMRTRQHLKPRQKAEPTDDVEGDLTTRAEDEDLTTFNEPEDVEPKEGEAERQETPNTKRSGVQGEEDEGAEIEFSEDDPETIKAIEEIQDSFRRLKAEAENEDDDVVEMSNEHESSEMEAAATKIQAGFKGMKLRKELKGRKLEKKAINEDPKEIQPEEETDAGNLSADENSDTELRVAANKIQAGFRGYKTRKEVQRLRKKKGEELASHSQEDVNGEHEVEEKIESDEDEGKRVVAASKIQAGFKGYKTRREVEILRKEKAKVSEKNEDEEKQMEDADENSDTELRVAANKIQAGFRGYKTRKEVQRLRNKKGEEHEQETQEEEEDA